MASFRTLGVVGICVFLASPSFAQFSQYHVTEISVAGELSNSDPKTISSDGSLWYTTHLNNNTQVHRIRPTGQDDVVGNHDMRVTLSQANTRGEYIYHWSQSYEYYTENFTYISRPGGDQYLGTLMDFISSYEGESYSTLTDSGFVGGAEMSGSGYGTHNSYPNSPRLYLPDGTKYWVQTNYWNTGYVRLIAETGAFVTFPGSESITVPPSFYFYENYGAHGVAYGGYTDNPGEWGSITRDGRLVYWEGGEMKILSSDGTIQTAPYVPPGIDPGVLLDDLTLVSKSYSVPYTIYNPFIGSQRISSLLDRESASSNYYFYNMRAVTKDLIYAEALRGSNKYYVRLDAVPEPEEFLVLSSGLGLLIFYRKRQK